MTNLQIFSFSASPIGHIPRDYPRLSELCHKANIRYNDVSNDTDHYRDWRIVPDANPSTTSSGVVKGNATTTFYKFNMLIDLIRHQHDDWGHAKVFDAALDMKEPGSKVLMGKPWKDMQNELARLGVRGYDSIRGKKARWTVDINL